jgi:acyl carrier protein
MNTKAILVQFIEEELLMGNDRGTISSETSLIGSGVLDSLSLLRLISFLEQQFDIYLEDDEIILDHFESLSAIEGLIASKQN